MYWLHSSHTVSHRPQLRLLRWHMPCTASTWRTAIRHPRTRSVNSSFRRGQAAASRRFLYTCLSRYVLGVLLDGCGVQMFDHGDVQSAGVTHAWLCKARVQHDARHFAAAKATAASALAALTTSDGTFPPAPGAVLDELSLILYSCLGELDDAARAAEGFTKIAGASPAHTPGRMGRLSTCFKQPADAATPRAMAYELMALPRMQALLFALKFSAASTGQQMPPTPCAIVNWLMTSPRPAGPALHTEESITSAHTRQAVRGLAACELNSGNTAEALRLYERLLGHQQPQAAANPLAAFEHILGSAAVSAQPPHSDDLPDAEHWAHGEYGWALFTAGRLEVCAATSPYVHAP